MENKQKTKKYQKWAFQLSIKILVFIWEGPKIPLFDNLAQKARTPKTL